MRKPLRWPPGPREKRQTECKFVSCVTQATNSQIQKTLCGCLKKKKS